MSLEGAQLISLDEAGNRGEIIVAKGRKFTVGYYANCDFVLTDDRAKGIHCTIDCDAFGRITIRNMSPEHPVVVNGITVDNKRNLFNNSTISILDKRYLWEFTSLSNVDKEDAASKEEVSTPKKHIGIPEHTGFSSPGVKTKKGVSRFTVHNFSYCIQSDEDGNISIESNKNDEEASDENIAEEKEENCQETSQAASQVAAEKPTEPEREVTPEPESKNASTVAASELGTPKMNLINCTNNKENACSTQKKNRLQLSMCHQSEVVITSFSPRETGVRTEKSFTAILMPKLLVTRAPNTPKSVYSTPKSVLGDDDDDDDGDNNEIDSSRDINFHTPSTSKKAGGLRVTTATKSLKNSSMHLIDYTTPKRLAPASPYLKSALKASAKKLPLTSTTEKISKNTTTTSADQLGVSALSCTPVVSDNDNNSALETPNSVQSVISVDSTDTSSVIEILSDESTTGHTPAKTPQKSQTTNVQSTTPMRTPQSLMKRAILGNRNKQATTPQRGADNVQTTPRRDPINRIPLRTSIGALKSPVTPKPTGSDVNTNRRLSMSTPSRKSLAVSGLKFESSELNTKFATPSPVRRSVMPKSAGKAPTTSTPLGTGSSYNRYSGCNTTPLNKVRKSFGGVALSSHISKSRKSIIAAAPSNFTSIKEKSPQQKMSDKILYRARKSLNVTPMIARAINLVQASKDASSSILKHSRTQRKSMAAPTTPSRSVLFADKQRMEQTIDRSLTFILDSEDDEESNVKTMKKKVMEKVASSTKLPQESKNTKNDKDSKPDEKEQIINLTFSPTKDEKTKQGDEYPATEETPLDVDEMPQGGAEDSDEDIQQSENILYVAESEDLKQGDEADEVIHIPLTSQPTEESFAEEILDTQRKEEKEMLQINQTEIVSASEVPDLKPDEIETGFGEEPELSITQDAIQSILPSSVAIEDSSESQEIATDVVDSEKKNLSEMDASQSHDVLDKSSHVYKPIYEDITLESSVIEKEQSKIITTEESLTTDEIEKNVEASEVANQNVTDNENNSCLKSNASTEQDIQEVAKVVLEISTDNDDNDTTTEDCRKELENPKETKDTAADVLEEDVHLTPEKSTKVTAEQTTTCKLLEEIDDVLNKSDEIDLKHLAEHEDNHQSIPTLTKESESESLTQESNLSLKANKDFVNAKEISNLESEQNKNIPAVSIKKNTEAVSDTENESEIENSIPATTPANTESEDSKETQAAADSKNESEADELLPKSSETEKLSQGSALEFEENNKDNQSALEKDAQEAVSFTKNETAIEESISTSSANEELSLSGHLDFEETKDTQTDLEKDDTQVVSDTKNKSPQECNEVLNQESNLEFGEIEDNQAALKKDDSETVSVTENETAIKESISLPSANEDLEKDDDIQVVSDTKNKSQIKERILKSDANEVLSQESNLEFEENKDNQDDSETVVDITNESAIEESKSTSSANEELSQKCHSDMEETKDTQTDLEKYDIEESISNNPANDDLGQERHLEFEKNKDTQSAVEEGEVRKVFDTNNESGIPEDNKAQQADDSDGKNKEEIDESLSSRPAFKEISQESNLKSEENKDTQVATDKENKPTVSNTETGSEVKVSDFKENENKQAEDEIDESISTSAASQQDLSLESKLKYDEEEDTQALPEHDDILNVSVTEKVGDPKQSVLMSSVNEELEQESNSESGETADTQAAAEKDDIQAVSNSKNEREIKEKPSEKSSANEELSQDINSEPEEHKENEASNMDDIEDGVDSKNECKKEKLISCANEELKQKVNLKSEDCKGSQAANLDDDKNVSELPKTTSEINPEIHKDDQLSKANDKNKLLEVVKAANSPKSRGGRRLVSADSAGDSKSNLEASASSGTPNTAMSVDTLTPRRTSRRKSTSAQLEVSCLKTPAKTIIENEAEAALTPRRSSRKKSISAEASASEATPITTLTPRRNTRRASITVEITTPNTPTTTNMKNSKRRSSLSVVPETPLTPKRITRRRSSMSLDTDEAIKDVQEAKVSLNDEPMGIIIEEIKEVMGAIVEEVEEEVESAETGDDETVINQNKVLTKERDAVNVVVEENVHNVGEEDVDDVATKSNQDLTDEITNVNVPEQVLTQDKRVDCETDSGDNEYVCDIAQDEENMAIVLDVSVQDLTEGEDKVMHSIGNDKPTVATKAEDKSERSLHAEGDVGEVVNVSIQDLTQDEESICREAGDKSVQDLTEAEKIMGSKIDLTMQEEAESKQGEDAAFNASIQDLTQDEESICRKAGDKSVQDLTGEEKVMGSKIDLTKHEEGDSKLGEDADIQDLTQDEESVCREAEDKSVQDLTEEENISEVVIESKIDLTMNEEGEPKQGEDAAFNITAEEEMETLEVSDDDSVYDYGKEVKVTAPRTPKAKKHERAMAGTPKTPIMTGVRSLLKTPKPEQGTPKLGALRHLLRTPKLKAQEEAEDEETEKLQGMQAIIKTPITAQPKEVRKDILKDSEKHLTGVKELLKTPKACAATPRFKGMRELMQTPKVSSTPGLGGVKELLDTPKREDHVSQSETIHDDDDECATSSQDGKKMKSDGKDIQEIAKDHKESLSSSSAQVVKDLKQTPETSYLLKASIHIESATTSQEAKPVVKELMSTPKSCAATPRFKGIRELMKTPKVSNTPILSGVKELLDTPKQIKKIPLEDLEDVKNSPSKVSSTTPPSGNTDKELTDSAPPTHKSDDEEAETAVNQLTCEKDYKGGVKDVMKTPKGCSTPRFKGIRELMKTPKMCSSTPVLDGIKELMHTPKQHNSNLDKFFMTPTAKNIMIPTLPSSAVIEKREDSVEMVHSIEYDLNDTHNEGDSDNLNELFKTPLATRFVDRLSVSYSDDGDDAHGQDCVKVNTCENEEQLLPDLPTSSKKLTSSLQTPSRKVYHRKSLLLQTPLAESPFSAADVLTDLSRTEVDDWVDKIDPLEQTININDDKDMDEEDDDDNDGNEQSENSKVVILDDSTADDDTLCVVPETCVKLPLANVSTSSEAMINISTVNITTSKDPLGKSTVLKSKQNANKRPISPSETADISGIDLLDETTDSILENSLVVSDEDNDEDDNANNNKSLNITSNQDNTLCEEADNDLSEPLLLSDDDDDDDVDGEDESEEASKEVASKKETDDKTAIPDSTELAVVTNVSTSLLEQESNEEELNSKAPNVEKDNMSNKNNQNKECEDIFLNDSTAEEAISSTVADSKEISETMPDKSERVESCVEKQTVKVSSPKECEDIFMEDSVSETSVRDTNAEVEGDVRSKNEDVKLKSIETVKTPTDTNEDEKAVEVHIEIGNTNVVNDDDVASKEVNENVSLSSQDEDKCKTSLSKIISLDATNNDDDVAQAESKTDEVTTEIDDVNKITNDASESVVSKNDGESEREEIISISESTSSEQVIQSENTDETEELSHEINNKEKSGDVISIDDDSSCEEVLEATNNNKDKDGGVVEIETVDNIETKDGGAATEERRDIDIPLDEETNMELQSNQQSDDGEASDVGAVSLSSTEEILACEKEIMDESEEFSEGTKVSNVTQTPNDEQETSNPEDVSSSTSRDLPKLDILSQQTETKTSIDSSKLDLTTDYIELSSDTILEPEPELEITSSEVANEAEVTEQTEAETCNIILLEENKQEEVTEDCIMGEISEDILKNEVSSINSENTNLIGDSEKAQDTMALTEENKQTEVTEGCRMEEDVLKEEVSTINPEKSNMDGDSEKIQDTLDSQAKAEDYVTTSSVSSSPVLKNIESSEIKSGADNDDECGIVNEDTNERATVESEMTDVGSNQTDVLSSSEAISKPDTISTSESKEQSKTETSEIILLETNASNEISSSSENNKSTVECTEQPVNQADVQMIKDIPRNLQSEDVQIVKELLTSEENVTSNNKSMELEDTSNNLIVEAVKVDNIEVQIKEVPETTNSESKISNVCKTQIEVMSAVASSDPDIKSVSDTTEEEGGTENSKEKSSSETDISQSGEIVTSIEGERTETPVEQQKVEVNDIVHKESQSDDKKSDDQDLPKGGQKLQAIPDTTAVETFHSYDIEVTIKDASKCVKENVTGANLTASESDEAQCQKKPIKRTRARKGSQSSVCSNDSDTEVPKTRRKRRNTKTEDVTPQPLISDVLHTVEEAEEIDKTVQEEMRAIENIIESKTIETISGAGTSVQETRKDTSNEKPNKAGSNHKVTTESESRGSNVPKEEEVRTNKPDVETAKDEDAGCKTGQDTAHETKLNRKVHFSENIDDDTAGLNKIHEIEDTLKDSVQNIEINPIERSGELEVINTIEEREVIKTPDDKVKDTEVAIVKKAEPAKRTRRKPSHMDSNSSETSDISKEKATEVTKEESVVIQDAEKNTARESDATSQSALPVTMEKSTTKSKLIKASSAESKPDEAVDVEGSDVKESNVKVKPADEIISKIEETLSHEESEKLSQKGAGINVSRKRTTSTTDKESREISKEQSEELISNIAEHNSENTNTVAQDDGEPKTAAKRTRRKATTDSTHEDDCSTHSRKLSRRKGVEEKELKVNDELKELENLSEITEEPKVTQTIEEEISKTSSKVTKESHQAGQTLSRRKASRDTNNELAVTESDEQIGNLDEKGATVDSGKKLDEERNTREIFEETKISEDHKNQTATGTVEEENTDTVAQNKDKPKPAAKRTRRKASSDSECSTHSRKLGRRKGVEEKEPKVIEELKELKNLSEITEEPKETQTTEEQISKTASKVTKESHKAGHTRSRRKASPDTNNKIAVTETDGQNDNLEEKAETVLEKIKESEEESVDSEKKLEEEQKTIEIFEEPKTSEDHTDKKATDTFEEEKSTKNIPEEIARHDSNESSSVPEQKDNQKKPAKQQSTTGDDTTSASRKIGRRKVHNKGEVEEDATEEPIPEDLLKNSNKLKEISQFKEAETKEAKDVSAQSSDNKPTQPTASRRNRRKASQDTDKETCTTKSRARHLKAEKTTTEAATLPKIEDVIIETKLTAEPQQEQEQPNENQQVSEEVTVSVEEIRKDHKNKDLDNEKYMKCDNKDQKLDSADSPIVAKEQEQQDEASKHPEDTTSKPVTKRGRTKGSRNHAPVEITNIQHSRRGRRLVTDPNLPLMEEAASSSRSRSENRKAIDEQRVTHKSNQEEEKIETKATMSESEDTKDSKVDKTSSLQDQNPPKKSIKRPYATSDKTAELHANEEPMTRRSRQEICSTENVTETENATIEECAAVSSGEKLEETSEPPVDEHQVSEKSDDVKHSDKTRKAPTRRKAVAAHSKEDEHQKEKLPLRSRRGQKAQADNDPGHQADHTEDQHDAISSSRSGRYRKAHDAKDPALDDDNFEDKHSHDEKSSAKSRKDAKVEIGEERVTPDDHSEDKHRKDEDRHSHDEKASLKPKTDIKPQDDASTRQDDHAEDENVLEQKSNTRSRRVRKAGGDEAGHQETHDDHSHNEKASTSSRRGRKVKEADNPEQHSGEKHDHDVKSASSDKANEEEDQSLNKTEKSSTRLRRGRNAHAVEENENQNDHPDEESKSTRKRAAVTPEESIPASRKRVAARKKVDHEKELDANTSCEKLTPGTKETATGSSRRKKDQPGDESLTTHEEPSQSLQKDPPSEKDVAKTETAESQVDHELNTSSEDSPNKRGRNVPQRRAATHHHSYDETSDSEKSDKRKKKPETPQKSMEAAKSIHLDTIVSESSSVPSPTLSLSSSAVTARGRTRKPTARVQQFLEEERAKAETPKRRAADTPTKGRPLKRGAKTADTDTEVVGTPQTNKQKRGRPAAVVDKHEDHAEEPTTSPTTAKGRKGTRKAKVDVHHIDDTEEPPAKKSPAALESEKAKVASPNNEATTPTRVAGRRNAAAAAKFRIEEDALAMAATDPPKKSRAKKPPVKATTIPASTVEEVENLEQPIDPVKEETKTATKRRGPRKAASSAAETTEPTEVELPAKRSRKGKAATETPERDTEPATETELSHSAATTRGGRRNVHFEAANKAAVTASTEEPATATTTKKRATRVRRI